MRNDLTPFRTVRELLVNRDEVLMSNAVGIDGQLYEDSVENLTAILAMKQDYDAMLEALEVASGYLLKSSYIDRAKWLAVRNIVDAAIAQAKGAAA